MSSDLQPGQLAAWPDHPVLCTFAARLPFALRLADGGVHRFVLTGTYVDAEEAKRFPGPPFVQVRVCNLPIGGVQIEPPTAQLALRALYGVELPASHFEPLPGLAYEQWISMETPSPRLSHEDAADAGYAFHRCIQVLRLFLRGHNIVFHDPHVHPLSTQELGNVVFLGEYEIGGKDWRYRSSMLMHPGRLPAYAPYRTRFTSESEAIAWGVAALLKRHPFTRSVELVLRSQHASDIRGDYSGAVVNLQTGLENRLFETWRLLLVDCGATGAEIARRLAAEMSFRSLLLTVLPRLLGGKWDRSDVDAPVGDCWLKLYLLRNRLVHRGDDASPAEFEAARVAYDRLRHFIRERLWANRNRYPRTALAVIGREGMLARGWSDPRFERRIGEFLAEPEPYFLPWDIAGRIKPSAPRRPSRAPGTRSGTSS